MSEFSFQDADPVTIGRKYQALEDTVLRAAQDAVGGVGIHPLTYNCARPSIIRAIPFAFEGIMSVAGPELSLQFAC